MKIKMKRLFGILLSLVLVLGLMPWMSMIAHAEETAGEKVITVTGTSGNLNSMFPCEGIEFKDSWASEYNVAVDDDIIHDHSYFYPPDGYCFTKVEVTKGKNPKVFFTGRTPYGVQDTSDIETNSDGVIEIQFTVVPYEVYNVTLHTDGGTINSGNITSYTEFGYAQLPTDVTKTGYTFEGWYTNSDLSGDKVVYIYDSTGDKEFWAKWEYDPNAFSYNVTFKVVNGAWNDGDKSDRTITLTGVNVTLATENIPLVGTKPDAGYKEGSWDITPTAGTAISSDVTYTYTYEADSDSDDDSSDNSSSNDSNNDSSKNSNSSNDSENSNSEPKAETPYDYLEPLRGDLKAEIALGGERTVTWDQGTALPYDIMKTLQDNPGVTLIFSYTYQGIDYKVTISGKDAKAYTEIPWYGPLYLYKHYGSSSETAPADTADTAIGTRTYTVIPGDTLSEIATKLNTTVDSLVSLNDIKNRDFILVGQILKY